MPTLGVGHSAASRRAYQIAPLPRRSLVRRVVGRWGLLRTIVLVLVMATVVTLEYTTIGNWFSDRLHDQQLSGYVQRVQTLTPAKVTAMLAAAHRYNAELPDGPYQDPNAVDTKGQRIIVGPGKPEYERLLNVGPDGMMGQILIPKIHVDLPIYHDTTEQSLAAGIGHLYGSGLPVGGKGVHAILSGHSGVPTATLFTNLDQLVLGDEFQIQVLDQVLTYRVKDIKVVLPDDRDDLAQVPGQDLVTLVTCTPIGVNSHRLLVTGIRVPTKQPVAPVFNLPGPQVGFPWWALVLVGAFLAGVFITRPVHRRRRRRGQDDNPWFDFVDRPVGSLEFRQWSDSRRRVLGKVEQRLGRTERGRAGHSRPGLGDASRSGPGLVTPVDRPAAGQVPVDSRPAGFSWALKTAAGKSLCISARLFASQAEAQADIERVGRNVEALVAHAVFLRRARVSWWVGDSYGLPLFFRVGTLPVEDKDGAFALADAHDALLDFETAVGQLRQGARSAVGQPSVGQPDAETEAVAKSDSAMAAGVGAVANVGAVAAGAVGLAAGVGTAAGAVGVETAAALATAEPAIEPAATVVGVAAA